MRLMTLLQIGVMLCWAACAAAFAAYAASIASEITYVTLADGRKTARSLPLVFRMLLPFVPNLSRFVARPGFASARQAADEMIVASGLEGLLTGAEFVALKFLTPITCGAAWTAFVLMLGALLAIVAVSLQMAASRRLV